MAIVYLGIGSNLGNREENIKQALDLLNAAGVEIIRCSTLIETRPVGGPANQGFFLNGAVKTATLLSPEQLLTKLKSIEHKMGRTATVRNGPRIIDIDILLYDQLTLNTPVLTIPHPRMFGREFVMRPLREIEPALNGNTPHAHH